MKAHFIVIATVDSINSYYTVISIEGQSSRLIGNYETTTIDPDFTLDDLIQDVAKKHATSNGFVFQTHYL